MENIEIVVNELRRRIMALRVGVNGKRLGIDDELKSSMVTACVQSQLSTKEFTKRVGVSESAFRKWRTQLDTSSLKVKKNLKRRFQSVEITPESPPRIASRFVVEGPCGIRVTGLNASEVVVLWRALC